MKLLFLCLVFLASRAVASFDPLNPKRIFLLDKRHGNFLFRGNLPETDPHAFADTLLKQYLKEAAQRDGHALPERFSLFDISFLTPTGTGDDEETYLNTEMSFFSAHPGVGSLISWPMFGDDKPPSDFPPDLRTSMAASLDTWQVDQLPRRIAQVFNMLDHKYDVPIVIYFHCLHGQDRTGEFAAAYQMQYLQQSFQTVWSFNKALGMDDEPKIFGLLWFCEYLNSLKYNLQCRLDDLSSQPALSVV